jgi:hypothetical protein
MNFDNIIVEFCSYLIIILQIRILFQFHFNFVDIFILLVFLLMMNFIYDALLIRNLGFSVNETLRRRPMNADENIHSLFCRLWNDNVCKWCMYAGSYGMIINLHGCLIANTRLACYDLFRLVIRDEQKVRQMFSLFCSLKRNVENHMKIKVNYSR